MIGASFGLEAQNWSAAWRMDSLKLFFSLVKVVCVVQLDGRMLRFLLQVGGGSSFNDGTTQTARDLPFGQPARTNHSCHLARLGATVVFVKPPQGAYGVHASCDH